MNTASLYAIAAVLLFCALLCHVAEKQSRKWYEDRGLLRAQGFFLALAGAALLWAVAK